MTALSKPSIFKQKVIDNFDAGAQFYDQYADIQKQIAIELADKINFEPKSVLEIGCGTGFLTNELIDRFPEAKITATDIALNMVARCQLKFKESDRLNLFVMDGENVQVSQKFDLIISSMTFQWFENLPKAIENLKHHLTPDGVINFTVPSNQSFPEWRAALAAANAASGLIQIPMIYGAGESKTYVKQYSSASAYLKSMKKIGAHTSGEAYQSLTSAQLKRACDVFDAGDRRVSWVIDYCKVQ